MSEDKAIVPLNLDRAPVIQEPKPTEIAQVEAKTISKFAEASTIEYTDAEKDILFAPVDVKDIQIRPDGQIYAEWAFYADRLDKAFGPGQWALSPAPWSPRLYREGNITYREYVLWIRGQFAANAVGHHEEQRRTANFGDAAEATYANALTRCCKRLGLARDLWKKDKIEEFKALLKRKVLSSDHKVESAASVHSKSSKPENETGPSAADSPDSTELLKRGNKAINAFYSEYGVGQKKLETYLKRDKNAWQQSDIDAMTEVYQKLRKGAKVDEFFAAKVAE